LFQKRHQAASSKKLYLQVNKGERTAHLPFRLFYV